MHAYKKHLLTAFLVTFTIISAFSSGSTNVKKLGDKAEEAFYFENYREAIELYYKLDSLDPEGHSYYMYQIGLSYLYSNLDNEQAIPNIEESVEELSQGELADALYYHLGRAYQVNYQFDKAIENYNKVLELVENYDFKGLQKEVTRQIEICNNAKEIVANPLDVKVKDVGSGVNTTWPDYKPIISTDESVMYFTSRRPNSTGEKVDETGRYYEDIYVTKRDVFGYWEYPTHISNLINTEFDEATIGVSADGSTMYLYKGDTRRGEIYSSTLVGDKWTEPVPAEKINSKFWETSATITGDGKTMYFVSNRKGGNGDRDIYQATLQEDGTWGDVKNLGAVINTAYDEDTPFIHPNGKTMYFSSTGHNTMGGFDIFKTELVNGEWTTPVNLGYPINTTCDDFHFVTNARGTRGYYSSAQTGGLGEQDIYTVDFKDVEEPILLVRGNVKTDGVDLAQSNPKITIVDKTSNNSIHTIYQPNSSTGKYLITLPPANEYDMIVEAEGFKPYQTTVRMPSVDEFHEVYQIITLRSLGEGKGQEIVVQNVFEDIRESSKDEELVEAANKNNRDYLGTVAQNLNDDVNNESAINQALNMTDQVSEKLMNSEDAISETSSSTLVYDDENPEKGLVPYTVDDHVMMVLTDDYKETTTISDDVADNTGTENSGSSSSSDDDTHAAAFTFEVKFGFDKYTLSENYLNDIEVVYTTYKNHKNAYIEVSGHTDSKGPEAYNIVLSQKRADAVAKYLMDKGVPKDHIVTKAMGESQPIAPNTNPDGSDNPEGRAKNRRTEIKIINH